MLYHIEQEENNDDFHDWKVPKIHGCTWTPRGYPELINSNFNIQVHKETVDIDSECLDNFAPYISVYLTIFSKNK